MSFVAELSLDKHKLVWSKAILALSLISEEIKFVISTGQLVISAINTTHTNNSEIIFARSFFQDYHVDFDGCISEGYENDTYSFIINSLHLFILFKHMDLQSLITFKIGFNTSFKLLIDIKRALVVKKYQINYHPIKNHLIQVVDEYKAEYHKESNKDIRYIMIDQTILKNFIDMIPLQTEEFRIEILNEKILFNGFTQLVLKDNNQYLKQPMSITISLGLDDLIETNLRHILGNQSINFKLKFFKIFINLINFIKSAKFDNLNDYFEMYFKNPGDPIVFELSNVPHIKINFVQLTNDEGLVGSDSWSSASASASAPATRKPVFKGYQLEQITRTSTPSFANVSTSTRPGSLVSHMNTMNPNTLATTNLSHPTKKDSPEIDQLDINFDSDHESEFGPTQPDEVKSIFD